MKLNPPEKVSLGGGYTVDAIGRGNVKLNCSMAERKMNTLELCDVLVPNLNCNLFSVRSAVSKGKKIESDGIV